MQGKLFLSVMLVVLATQAGCASGAITQVNKAEFENTIPVCDGESDCKAKWEAAQLWIVHNAGFKLQTVTDVLLETFNPGPSDARIAVRVTKEPLGGSRYRLLVFVWCNNIFGCVPDGWTAALNFNREVGAAAAGAAQGPPATENQPGDQIDQLERLARLREQGVLSEDEFNSAKKRVLAGGVATQVTAPTVQGNRLEAQPAAEFCAHLLVVQVGTFTELSRVASSTRSSSTASDGTGRGVVVACSWDLVSPRPATLSVVVGCADTPPSAQELCASVGQPTGSGNPACMWGTERSAKAAITQGCVVEGSLTDDPRKAAPNANPITIDVRDILRTMANRI